MKEGISNLLITYPVIVFGSTGYIGRSFVRLCSKLGIFTIGVSRTENSACSISKLVNFIDSNSIDKLWLDIGEDTMKRCAIVFCHRARVDYIDNKSSIDSITVEVNPYLSLSRYLSNSNKSCKISIVSVTSNASMKFARELDPTYHISKHAQIGAAKSLGYVQCSSEVYSNVLSFGDLRDSSLRKHSDYHLKLHGEIRKVSGYNEVATKKELVRFMLLLCEAHRLGISGQTITIDKGLGSLSQDSILRYYSN